MGSIGRRSNSRLAFVSAILVGALAIAFPLLLSWAVYNYAWIAPVIVLLSLILVFA